MNAYRAAFVGAGALAVVAIVILLLAPAWTARAAGCTEPGHGPAATPSQTSC